MRRNRCKGIHRYLFMLFLVVISLMSISKSADAATYKVNPSTKPYKNAYTKEKTYNKYTKQYYVLRSYLERLEVKGGGTLILKKGTYKISNTLYIPSNVTIKMSNGCSVKKTIETGTKKLKSDKVLFALVAPSKSNKKDALGRYKGSQNVSIIGSGSAYINMDYCESSVGIVVGHNNNVVIQNIRFKNSYGGSFITIAASKLVTVQQCKFYNHKDKSGYAHRYAIRLEVPDSVTKAFPYKWSKADYTANNGIYITNNTFNKLNSAIGSVKYAVQSVTKDGITMDTIIYQKNIQITSNKFSNLDKNNVRALNWERPIFISNIINNVNNGEGTYYGILMSGVINPSVTGNTFDLVARPLGIEPGVNTGVGKQYATTYNTINSDDSTKMAANIVNNAKEYYVRYHNGTSESRLAYYDDNITKDYVIEMGKGTFRDHYTNDFLYNSYTNDFFVFKSYLEQLEHVGGGTLTIKPGTYSITNTVYVPSNVTIIMENGVTINKGTYNGISDSILKVSESMFQCVPPSLSLVLDGVGGYNGSQNIRFIGQGTAIIDMMNFLNMKAIVMGHNQNVEINGITFQNMNGHHFIELDASKNVVIQNCIFMGHTDSTNNNKEAINLDTPDSNTGGFNQVWTNHDRTPNLDVAIKNNKFINLERAIGTHKYSVTMDTNEQVYHTNIQVTNNTFMNIDNTAIYAMNWKDFLVQGNTFEMATTTHVILRGVVNPSIKENVFKGRGLVLTAQNRMNSGSGADSLYPVSNNQISELNIQDMLNNSIVDISKAYFRIYPIFGDTATYTKYEFDASKYSFTENIPLPTPQPEEETIVDAE